MRKKLLSKTAQRQAKEIQRLRRDSQTIPFESEKVARFSIPVDATQDDLLLLHDMFDVILKSKFEV